MVIVNYYVLVFCARVGSFLAPFLSHHLYVCVCQPALLLFILQGVAGRVSKKQVNGH